MSEFAEPITFESLPTTLKYLAMAMRAHAGGASAAAAPAAAHAAAAPAAAAAAGDEKAGAPKKEKVKKEKKEKDKGDKERKGRQLATRDAPVIETPNDAQFGDIRIVQSQYRTDRKFVEIKTIDETRAGQAVWFRGRISAVRGKGKTCFLVFRRGFATLQGALFASDTTPADFVKYAQKIPVESIVDVYGTVRKVDEPTNTTQSTVEVSIEKLYVLSAAAALPFQVVDASNPELPEDASGAAVDVKDDGIIRVNQDTRLNNRWIDLRTPANHAIFRLQSAVGTYYRQFFLDNGFVEIHTPKITPGVSEGGAAVFRLKYFNDDACLAQSPQLYKQMAAACSDFFRVFEIGQVFRAENSFTHRHLCEFVGLDFEMEIKEHFREVTKVLGDLFVYIFDKIKENHQRELAAINAQFPFEPLKYKRETLILDFKEAVAMLNEAGPQWKMGPYDDFSTPQEKKLGELVKAKYDTEFYIVDRYPLAARPFYTMPCPEDPMYTNSYDVFLRGEEITSGAQRIHDVELLKKRAAQCNIPESNISAYVESFKSGAPPHGGAGIGLERVVMLFLGLNNIRKSSMFPRDPKRLAP